jgi:hypothetical protein
MDQDTDMVACEGQMRSAREGIFEYGMGKMFKKAATDQGAQLMKSEGTGYLCLADPLSAGGSFSS